MKKHTCTHTHTHRHTDAHTNTDTNTHTHRALPGIFNLFAVNQSPKNVYVLYEAAVSLQIVVKTRSL